MQNRVVLQICVVLNYFVLISGTKYYYGNNGYYGHGYPASFFTNNQFDYGHQLDNPFVYGHQNIPIPYIYGSTWINNGSTNNSQIVDYGLKNIRFGNGIESSVGNNLMNSMSQPWALPMYSGHLQTQPVSFIQQLPPVFARTQYIQIIPQSRIVHLPIASNRPVQVSLKSVDTATMPSLPNFTMPALPKIVPQTFAALSPLPTLPKIVPPTFAALPPLPTLPKIVPPTFAALPPLPTLPQIAPLKLKPLPQLPPLPKIDPVKLAPLPQQSQLPQMQPLKISPLPRLPPLKYVEMKFPTMSPLKVLVLPKPSPVPMPILGPIKVWETPELPKNVYREVVMPTLAPMKMLILSKDPKMTFQKHPAPTLPSMKKWAPITHRPLKYREFVFPNSKSKFAEIGRIPSLHELEDLFRPLGANKKPSCEKKSKSLVPNADAVSRLRGDSVYNTISSPEESDVSAIRPEGVSSTISSPEGVVSGINLGSVHSTISSTEESDFSGVSLGGFHSTISSTEESDISGLSLGGFHSTISSTEGSDVSGISLEDVRSTISSTGESDVSGISLGVPSTVSSLEESVFSGLHEDSKSTISTLDLSVVSESPEDGGLRSEPQNTMSGVSTTEPTDLTNDEPQLYLPVLTPIDRGTHATEAVTEEAFKGSERLSIDGTSEGFSVESSSLGTTTLGNFSIESATIATESSTMSKEMAKEIMQSQISFQKTFMLSKLRHPNVTIVQVTTSADEVSTTDSDSFTVDEGFIAEVETAEG